MQDCSHFKYQARQVPVVVPVLPSFSRGHYLGPATASPTISPQPCGIDQASFSRIALCEILEVIISGPSARRLQ